MRLLFILGSPHANYLEDLVLAGLVAQLGADNVDYWPAKDHFTRVRPERYPERMCWPGIALGAAIGRGEALQRVRTEVYDIILFGTPREATEAAFMEDIRDVAFAAGRPPIVAMLNGEDRVAPRVMESVLPKGPWFIREMAETPLSRLPGRDHSEGSGEVVPLALCYNAVDLPARVAPMAERDIDILWVGSVHHGRQMYVDALRVLPNATVVTEPTPHMEYLKLLGRAKSAVVLHGAGQQTYRLWEVMAQGCIPIWQRVAELDVVDWTGDFEFADLDEMQAAIDDLHRRIKRFGLTTFQDEFRSTLIRRHTHIARATELLSALIATTEQP